jgi:CO dehydrogenase/acetyl-CoA synthase alpha subunit
MALNFRCADCNENCPTIFALKDAVWLALAEKRSLLCIRCTQKRCQQKLHRSLTRADFKLVPVNDSIFFALDNLVPER